MPTETPNHSHESDTEETRRTELSADALRVGDTVVWTSKLNKEYQYEVADIDSTWITFKTGLMVHTDRFERGAFEVVRDRDGPTDAAVDIDGQLVDPNARANAADGSPIGDPAGAQASASKQD